MAVPQHDGRIIGCQERHFIATFQQCNCREEINLLQATRTNGKTTEHAAIGCRLAYISGFTSNLVPV
jgi:hypothetical protein